MDKQAPRNDTFSPLPAHRVIALHGRDAVAFAQAQCMNDVSAISPGNWQWNGWLTPKGRVIALFALLQLDSETLWLVSHDSNAATLATALRRFVFRSKVQLTVRDDVQALGAFARPAIAAGNRLHVDDAHVIELDMGGEGGARCLRLIPIDAVTSVDADVPAATAIAAVDAAFVARWTAFDLAHGLPHLADGPAEQWTPQQLSLQRLRAYSVAKGCYPGQEIVARTHFLGQAKRALVSLTSAAQVTVGSEVHHDGRAIGSVVSSVTQAGGAEHALLAVLPVAVDADAPLQASDVRLQASDVQLVRQTLLDGLAR